MSNEINKPELKKTDRRAFLGRIGTAAAGTIALGAMTSSAQDVKKIDQADENEFNQSSSNHQRRNAARKVRLDATQARFQETAQFHPNNGDEQRYHNKIGSYSKAMPHDGNGVVAPAAYAAFLTAVNSGDPADYEAIPVGGTVKQVSPQAAYAFNIDSGDSHSFSMPAPPKYASEEEGAEMAEVYWQAVTRDIPFSDYGTDATIGNAVTDLNRFSRFSGVTRASLFRGETPGDLAGPYISQFLYKTIPYGATTIEQKYNVPLPTIDFMTSYSEWLNIQNGLAPSASLSIDPVKRFIRNGRDLGEWVHRDYSFQGFLDAALILLSFGGGALAASNPYLGSTAQAGFVQFGGAHIVDMVSRAGLLGLKAAWYQKWNVHRRLRPEAFAGDVHNKIVNNLNRPIHPLLLSSPVLPLLFSQHGSYLLPMAFSEGSPTHPAYPAGHATIAGACTTILKAFFKESFNVPSPVEPDASGLALNPYPGSLTVGGELNKLAANISIGRDTAGVHWRSDGIEGMNLGEQVAISLLKDYKETYNENFAGFSFTKFNGQPITI